MYIKQVTVDGFKSYAQRTEISGFDPFFNAITGLNGSGKSNILDSICFLLGITNLTQVRASSLQDLVYKSGQAGINKATVSITFDNKDKTQSPMGMEAHNEITITRQIVIGGRNKYLINGVNAQNARVTDLFRSVGLNVNNPHFLIMQGRVTKVMNMKPPEILSMIEEATGTSMYEAKKESAVKMIKKKETKLAQINRNLDEEITPTLQKLRDERASYLEYQKVQREGERLTRLLVAYQFIKAEKVVNNNAGIIESLTKEKEQLELEAASAMEKWNMMVTQLSEMESNLDQEGGLKLKELENLLGEKEKSQAKAQSSLKNKKEELNGERKTLKNIQKNWNECDGIIKKKEQTVEKLVDICEKAEKESEDNNKAYEQAQKTFQAVSAGLAAADEGEEASWNSQLLQCKKNISQLQSETKQTQMKLKHTTKELKSKQSELKHTEATYKKEEEILKKAQKMFTDLETQSNKLNYREGEKEELMQERKMLSNQISQMNDGFRDIYRKFPSLQFNYKDPERNWDRRKVRGLVAELVDLKDIKSATALEVVAGGRLYFVVVDDHITASKLIQHGELKRRCTTIPLNKVSSRTLNPDIIRKAKNLVGEESVDLALHLIEHGGENHKALEYVFGTTLVCDTMENARKVAFHPSIRCRTVTLAGEVYDPSGTLSGGSRSRFTPVLGELMKSKSSRQNLANAESSLEKLERKLSSVSEIASRFRDLRSQLGVKKREVEMLEQKLSDGSHGRLLEEIDNLQKLFDDCSGMLATSDSKMSELQEKAKSLERKIADAPAERERELKKAELEVERLNKLVEKTGQISQAKREELNTFGLEITAFKDELQEYEKQIRVCEQTISQILEVYETMKPTVSDATEAVKEAKQALKNQREHIQDMNQKIKDHIEEKNKGNGLYQQLKTKVEAQENLILKQTREESEASSKVNTMLTEHDWIANEKALFGKSGSAYDFQANPPQEAARRLDTLKKMQEALGQSVNMRAMSLLSKAEERYNELIKKKSIVISDKIKIEKTIEELDQIKNEAVTKAYVQVNQNFANIFSMLLPGATAKLAPPEGSSVLAGLQFQVGFGGIWKTNLNELSGGQRSLVALSLILAMLLLKPAPIYILDEVDAALDLSHTQNIGRMLKAHFKHSQFIVVSLKDGMFNNANVLFRTKFVDGVSTVQRYAQATSKGRNPLSSLPVANEAENQPNPRRK